MKALVLGAGGQLGQALVKRFQKTGVPFIAKGKQEADVTDKETIQNIVEGEGFTHIYNCSAYTKVDLAQTEESLAFAVNAKGPENLALIAKEEGAAFIHVSTDYVFDGESAVPYRETDTPHPINVYGKSKLEGEVRVQDAFAASCIVRTSWVFGSEGNNFISNVLKKLYTEPTILAVDDQYNRATFVEDLVDALLGLSDKSGLFHFANKGAVSRYEIAKHFYDYAKEHGVPINCTEVRPVPASHFPSSTPRPMYSVMDTSKVAEVLGKQPRTWESVLDEFFATVQAPA